MKFTRDLCRLLGLGGDGAEETQMEVQDGAPHSVDRRTDEGLSQCLEQAMLSSEEGLDEDEKTRRRAEKRRAKKKRQKERRKLESRERRADASEQVPRLLHVVFLLKVLSLTVFLQTGELPHSHGLSVKQTTENVENPPANVKVSA